MWKQLGKAAATAVGGATFLGTGAALLGGSVRWLGWVFVAVGATALAVAAGWVLVVVAGGYFVRLLAPALAREIEQQGLLDRAVAQIQPPAAPSTEQIAAAVLRALPESRAGSGADPEADWRERRRAANEAITTLEGQAADIKEFATEGGEINGRWQGDWGRGRDLLAGLPSYQFAVRETERAFQAIRRVGSPSDPNGTEALAQIQVAVSQLNQALAND